jgi:ankyrin repeat protein
MIIPLTSAFLMMLTKKSVLTTSNDQCYHLPLELWHIILPYLDNTTIYRKTLTLNRSLYELSWKYLNKSSNDNYAIIYSCENGYTDRVRILLKEVGVDPSATRNSALLKAIENGHSDIVRILLEHPKVNPGADFNSSIILACMNGYIGM